MKIGGTVMLILLAGLWLETNLQAQDSSIVIIAFSTTNSTPLNLGFAGFATEILDTGLEYDNTNVQNLAKSLSPGWLR